MTVQTVRVPFFGAHLGEVRLEVACFAEFLRDADNLCAFCHGDPIAERRCRECGGGFVEAVQPADDVRPRRVTWRHHPHADRCTTVTFIDREFMACPEYAPFETCPCCQGRPT